MSKKERRLPFPEPGSERSDIEEEEALRRIQNEASHSTPPPEEEIVFVDDDGVVVESTVPQPSPQDRRKSREKLKKAFQGVRDRLGLSESPELPLDKE